MMIPVRCFTCGKVIGSAYEPYKARTAAGEDPARVLDALGLERHCCRRMILTHSDTIDEAAKFHV